MTLLRSASPALALAMMMIAPTAWAQTPPPAPGALSSPPAAPPAAVQAPPAGYAPPPAGYAPPPAGYAPPPAGYAPPPDGYAPPPGYSNPPGYRPSALGPVGPKTLPYQDGYPIPDGYHPEMRFRSGLIIGGAVTFGVMYSISVAAATTGGEGFLAVPVAGPFLELSRLNFNSGSSDSPSLAGVVATVLVIDGVAQLAGAAMLIVGLTQKKQVLVREDVAKSSVRVTPMGMGYGGMGIGLVGTM